MSTLLDRKRIEALETLAGLRGGVVGGAGGGFTTAQQKAMAQIAAVAAKAAAGGAAALTAEDRAFLTETRTQVELDAIAAAQASADAAAAKQLVDLAVLVAGGMAGGNIAGTGNFEGGSAGQWSAGEVITLGAPVNGYAKGLHLTDRVTLAGPVIPGNLIGRKFRFRGLILAPGPYDTRVGFRVQRTNGTTEDLTLLAVAALTPAATAFDVLATIAAETTSYQPILISDGPEGAADHDATLVWLDAQEVTAAENAALAADAAASSASEAQSRVTEAEAAASAASDARTEAETFRSQAQTFSTQATEAKDAAETAAATATAAVGAVSQVYGGTLLANVIFAAWTGTYPDGATVTLGGATFTKVDAYFGWGFDVAGTVTDAGHFTYLAPAHAKAPQAWAVEKVAVTLTIELLDPIEDWDAIEVRGQWTDASSAVREHAIPLAEYLSPTAGRIQTIEVILDRPAGFTYSGEGGFRAAIRAPFGGTYNFRVHRFDARQITSRSVADLTLKAATQLDGLASSAIVLRAKAGAADGTLELVAADDPVTGPATSLRVNADQILLDGSVKTRHLTVGSGKNILLNSVFANGTAVHVEHMGSGNAHSGATLTMRPPGTFAGADYHTMQLYTPYIGDSGYTRASFAPRDRLGAMKIGYPVIGGNWYEWAAQLSLHRTNNARMWITWFDATGAAIGDSSVAVLPSNVPSDTYNPNLWPRYGGVIQAPANAAFARPHFQFSGATSSNGYIFCHHPLFAESAEGAALSAWSDGGQTTIDGGMMRTGMITADMLTTGELITLAAQIKNAIITRAHIGLLEVDEARIANLTVGTDKITGSAVTRSTSWVSNTSDSTVSMPTTGGVLVCWVLHEISYSQATSVRSSWAQVDVNGVTAARTDASSSTSAAVDIRSPGLYRVASSAGSATVRIRNQWNTLQPTMMTTVVLMEFKK